MRRDNCVRDAGLILEADEYESFRRAGTLAANDIARDAHNLVMARVTQIGGAKNITELAAD